MSERLFYQKITDLYATAIDYDKDAQATRRFYATVQNKMHYATTGSDTKQSHEGKKKERFRKGILL
jgi:hypothetical protein